MEEENKAFKVLQQPEKKCIKRTKNSVSTLSNSIESSSKMRKTKWPPDLSTRVTDDIGKISFSRAVGPTTSNWNWLEENGRQGMGGTFKKSCYDKE